MILIVYIHIILTNNNKDYKIINLKINKINIIVVS